MIPLEVKTYYIAAPASVDHINEISVARELFKKRGIALYLLNPLR